MRRRGVGVTAGAALLVWALLLPPAQAGPGDPGPRPPLSYVLAVDPSTVPTPEDGASVTAPAPCPQAGYGVRTSARGRSRTVALTFDDGPGRETAAIIRVLEDAGVTGTFFPVGVNTTVRPEMVRAEAVQGFALGNHTWAHADMRGLSAAAQAAAMDRASAQQRSLTGSVPCFFRPPYGSYDSTTLRLAQSRGMQVWNWSVDTLDWQARGSSSQLWVDRIVARAQAGGRQSNPVVLMHDQPGGSPATLAALPRIITYYRDRGYAFVDLYGRTADRPVTGDWNGDGIDTPGVVHGSTWYLRDSNDPANTGRTRLTFGTSSSRPVAGDWNGDGVDTPGTVSRGTWHLRATNRPTSDTVVRTFGAADHRPVVGDWNGDGVDTPGTVSGTTWSLRNTNATSSGKLVMTYGSSTDRPVTGDWDGDGATTPGVVRGDGWLLRNANTTGRAHTSFTFGP